MSGSGRGSQWDWRRPRSSVRRCALGAHGYTSVASSTSGSAQISTWCLKLSNRVLDGVAMTAHLTFNAIRTCSYGVTEHDASACFTEFLDGVRCIAHRISLICTWTSSLSSYRVFKSMQYTDLLDRAPLNVHASSDTVVAAQVTTRMRERQSQHLQSRRSWNLRRAA